MKLFNRVFAVLLVCALGGVTLHGQIAGGELSDDVKLDWVVVGGLPNEVLPADKRVGGNDGAGFDRDYLDAMGGENIAVLRDNSVVTYVDDKGKAWKAEGIAVSLRHGAMMDFTGMVKPYDRRVAYAYTEIASDSDGEMYALFGSDDRAKVWVNGEQVHEFRAYGRGTVLGDDKFSFPVKQGKNRVLVKVENGHGGWGFALKLSSKASYEQKVKELAERGLYERLMQTRISRVIGDNGGGTLRYMFGLGSFPKLDFENPELAKQLLGDYEISVRWFDTDSVEVERATQPGRYAAVIKVTGENGREINRGYTFICYPGGYNWKRILEKVDVGYFQNLGISKEVWKEQGDWINKGMYYGIRDYMFTNPDGAALLSGLFEREMMYQRGEVTEEPEWLSPMIRNQDYLLKVRMRVTDRKATGKLTYPKRVDGLNSTILRDGSLSQAGFKEGFAEAMREVCDAWAEEGGMPFTVVVARNGVIAYDSAHGSKESGPIDEMTTYQVASISKLMFSSLLSMMRYEGLIELDKPLGKYVDGFPVEGEKAVTVRQCMMHLAGTEGHVNYGGMPNLWFDDYVRSMWPYTYPGEKYQYNGLSLNLVARACELASGESFPRLMQEHLWRPLGCVDTTSVDTSTYTRTTARDLAKVGQMLLNGGSYGDLKFFDAKTRDEMLPVRIGDLYDDTSTPNVVYGLASDWYRDIWKQNEQGERELVFSERMFGHGSATASLFRVDLENQLVITMSRPGAGKQYNTYYQKMFKTIGEYMIK
ncbi:D-alanyl-D-alanine-carboxypeptidase/endopeptidase AmpH precursor [Poriferisphaera corsica]|uniref:D-alanyl-D-alanine-carboxypeptidase/endopeptidase AmpH n=1 Tax=Poriferisphaera corsica TaxID=2528020 RepID=A0A517YTR4_9BACT|nr:serine hydrolase domain-containing protein [Poriferisphaera corsica]QDU33608.1 D-alanyl-D-alanine-carboxypeptidase/endopeptidase AmpH precursor [Poriferisphaera corsica]